MYTENIYESFLYHSGIKDQKWGIRRFQNYDGSLTPEGKERYSKKDLKKAKKELKKAEKEKKKYERSQEYIDSLDDKELRERINRLQMEQQYKNLTKPQMNAGQKFVKDVLYESSKEIAKEYTKKGMKIAIQAGLPSVVDNKEQKLPSGTKTEKPSGGPKLPAVNKDGYQTSSRHKGRVRYIKLN